MSDSDSEDYQRGSRIGKLLGLFFVVVVLCAICFALGYGLGRSSRPAAVTEMASTSSTPPASAKTSAAKAQPPEGDPQAAKKCQGDENCPPDGMPNSQDLSFYKAVEKKNAGASLTPPQPAPAAKAAPAPPAETRTAAKPSPATPAKSAPAESNLQAGVMVQVAAVSKREDAEILQNALRRKQYPVLITTAPNDRLFHVQIGPFKDVKDAESTRTRLQGDGYNPILKR